MEIIEIIRSYIEKPNTDYAIMIAGKWGSGKTFFLKNKIIPRLEDIRNSKTGKKFKCLYISLNGVKEISQITSQIISNKYPLTRTKIVKIVKSLGSSLIDIASNIPRVNQYSGSQSVTSLDKIQIQDFLNFQNNILCFDDLERKSESFSIQDILGYINTNFVEHNYIKTIIIADEEQIDERINKQYHSRKEKIIGRTIPFDSTYNTLDELLSKYKEDSIYLAFLKRNETFITELRNEYSIENLRTFYFILDILNMLNSAVSQHLFKDIEKEIIFFTTAISLEFKVENLKASDAKNNKGLERLTSYGIFDIERWEKLIKKEKTPKNYYEEFADRYLAKYSEYYFFYESIYRFILSGFLDDKQFENEIEKSISHFKSKKEDPAQRALGRLWQYNELNDEEIAQLIHEVGNYTKAGRYPFFQYGSISLLFQTLNQNELTSFSPEYFNRIVDEGYSHSNKEIVISDIQIEDILKQIEKLNNPVLAGWIKRDLENQRKIEDGINANEFFNSIQFSPEKFDKTFRFQNIFRKLSAQEIVHKVKFFDFKVLDRFTSYIYYLSQSISPEEIKSIGENLKQFKDEIIREKSNVGATEKYHAKLLGEAIEKSLKRIPPAIDTDTPQ